MKKEILLKIVEEIITYIIAITFIEVIAHKLGWIESSVIDNVIGLSIGFILWKIIMLFVNKRKQK